MEQITPTRLDAPSAPLKQATDRRLRVLVIAEAANPEWVSVPLEGWELATALREVADVHIVTQIRNRDAFVRAGLTEGVDFTAIDSEGLARPINAVANRVRGGKGKGWTTMMAFNNLSYYWFEHLVWKQFGREIRDQQFDVVHRVTPLSPTTPSILAKRCNKAGVPFVLGPMNGGLPWPAEFDSARRQEKEWLSYLRGAYRFLPYYRSTRRHAAAIITGSYETYRQMPAWTHDRCVYVPENGLNTRRFSRQVEHQPQLPLRLCFVGRLVPYKGIDMLLEAALPLFKSGEAHLTVLGDGPMMPDLKQLVAEHQLEQQVALPGWVSHTDLQQTMVECDVFAFPSVREFGGAVVIEAMAMGLVPIIVDYGGPGEHVTADVGFKVPLGPRAKIIDAFRQRLEQLVKDPAQLIPMRKAGQHRARHLYSWQAKSRQVLEVYDWVTSRRNSKPDFSEQFGH